MAYRAIMEAFQGLKDVTSYNIENFTMLTMYDKGLKKRCNVKILLGNIEMTQCTKKRNLTQCVNPLKPPVYQGVKTKNANPYYTLYTVIINKYIYI